MKVLEFSMPNHVKTTNIQFRHFQLNNSLYMSFGSQSIFKKYVGQLKSECPRFEQDHNSAGNCILKYTDPKQLLKIACHLAHPECCLPNHLQYRFNKFHKFLRWRSKYGAVKQKSMSKNAQNMLLLNALANKLLQQNQFRCCHKQASQHQRKKDVRESDKHSYDSRDPKFINYLLSSIAQDEKGQMIGHLITLQQTSIVDIFDKNNDCLIDNQIKRFYCAALNYQEPSIYYQVVSQQINQTNQMVQTKKTKYTLNHNGANFYFRLDTRSNRYEDNFIGFSKERLLNKFQNARRIVLPQSQLQSQFQLYAFAFGEFQYFRVFIITQAIKLKNKKFFIDNQHHNVNKNNMQYKSVTYSVDQGILSYNWSYPKYTMRPSDEHYEIKTFADIGQSFHLISGSDNPSNYNQKFFRRLNLTIKNAMIFGLQKLKIGNIQSQKFAKVYLEGHAILILNHNQDFNQEINIINNIDRINNYKISKIKQKIIYCNLDDTKRKKILNIILFHDNELRKKEITYTVSKNYSGLYKIEIQFANVNIAILTLMKIHSMLIKDDSQKKQKNGKISKEKDYFF